MARRLDYLGRLDARQRTPQGGLRVTANLTRTGIFLYHDARGQTVREYRPPEEVFKVDSLDTLKLAPLVVGHPDSVRTDNWREVSVGVVAENVRPEGIYVASDVLVQDGSTIDRIDSGDLLELSCGYEVRIDHTPGTTPEGEPYDAVQRDIRYNHVGLGPAGWGRAGSEVRLHLDGNGDVVPYAAGMTLEEAKKRIDALEAERDALKSDNDKLRTESNAQKTRADQAEAKCSKLLDPAKIPDLVAARSALESNARLVLGPTAAFSKKDSNGNEVHMTDEDIVHAVLTKAEPDLKTDGRSADYVRGRFDHVVERVKKEDRAHNDLGTSINEKTKTGETSALSRLDQALDKADAEAKQLSQAGPPPGALVRK